MVQLLTDGRQRWSWEAKGKRLILNCEEGVVQWKLPFRPGKSGIHPDLLMVATQALLSPWHKDLLQGWTPTRPRGNKVGLAFSGGIDSTAAMLLLPDDAVLAYHRRSYKSLLKHHGVTRLFRHLKKSGERCTAYRQITKSFVNIMAFRTDSARTWPVPSPHSDGRSFRPWRHCLWHAHRQHLPVARPPLEEFALSGGGNDGHPDVQRRP